MTLTDCAICHATDVELVKLACWPWKWVCRDCFARACPTAEQP